MKENIIHAVDNERDHQDQKWGTVSEHPHTVGEWILLMEEYISKARSAWVTGSGDVPALFRILQVSSLGVACMDQHGSVERKDRDQLYKE